jgi:DNA-binding response OmpR family regulator
MQILVLDTLSKKRNSLTSVLKIGNTSLRHTSREILASNLQSLDRKSASVLPIAICTASAQESQEIVEELRSKHSDVPIIVAQKDLQGSEVSQILDVGADDAVSLPILPQELMSRIHAIMRRAINVHKSTINLGWISINLAGGFPEIQDHMVPLTGKEFAIFQLLAINADKVVSRKVIYNSLYSLSDSLPFEKGIDVHIFNIRKKLNKISANAGLNLETVTGRGFILRSENKKDQSGDMSTQALIR